MSDRKTASGGGIGFCGALFLLFLGLRLTDNIDWEWYWVAGPLWMPLGLVLGVAAIVFPIALLMDWSARRKRVAARRMRDGVPKL